MESREDFKILLWGISEAMLIREPTENFSGSVKSPKETMDLCMVIMLQQYSEASTPDIEAGEAICRIHIELDFCNEKKEKKLRNLMCWKQWILGQK